MLMGMSFLVLHIAAMALVFISLVAIFRIANHVRWPLFVALSLSVCGLFVLAVKSLALNSDYQTAAAILRSEIYGAALGENNFVILNREYRLTRIPRDEDHLDNDDVDENPELHT